MTVFFRRLADAPSLLAPPTRSCFRALTEAYYDPEKVSSDRREARFLARPLPGLRELGQEDAPGMEAMRVVNLK